MPPGFAYIALSTSSVTTDEPEIIQHQGSGSNPGYQELIWDLTSLELTLNVNESVTLTFDATASDVVGDYCNEAWVDPGGITLTGTSATNPAQAEVRLVPSHRARA